MKKNIFRSVILGLAATVVALGFSACSDDDNNLSPNAGGYTYKLKLNNIIVLPSLFQDSTVVTNIVSSAGLKSALDSAGISLASVTSISVDAVKYQVVGAAGNFNEYSKMYTQIAKGDGTSPKKIATADTIPDGVNPLALNSTGLDVIDYFRPDNCLIRTVIFRNLLAPQKTLNAEISLKVQHN